MGALIRSPRIAGKPHRLRLPGSNGAAGKESSRSTTEVGADADHGRQLDEDSAATGTPTAESAALTAADKRAAQAEARAAQLADELQALRDHLDEHRETARHEGLDAGIEEGRTQAAADAREHAARLQALMVSLEESAGRKLANEEDDLAEAVFAAVGKIIGRRLTTRRGAAGAVRQVCKQIASRNGLIARVAPDDLEFLSADEDLRAALGGRVKFEADAGVALGGCLVESTGGTLDGRLETQLERLKRVLLRARSKRNGD